MFHRSRSRTRGRRVLDNILIRLGRILVAQQADAAALRQAAESFATLFEATGEGIFIHEDGTIVAANRAYAAMLGCAVAELIGGDGFAFLAPESHDIALRHRRDGDERAYEATVVRRDSTTFPVEIAGRAILYRGRPARLVTLRDISERVAATAALRANETRYRALVEQLPTALYVNPIGPDAVSRYVSPYIATLTGYTPQEWLDEQRHGGTRLHAADRARVLAAGARSAATGQPFTAEYRFVRKDGTVVWVRDEALIVRDGPEQPPRWQGFLLDITARVRAEAARNDSEARYRQMFEGNRAIQLVLDPDTGAIVDANPAACAFYGYPPEALTALTIGDINTLAIDELGDELATAAAERREYFRFRHRRASGEIRDVEVHSSPLAWRGRRLLFSIIHDITDRTVAEARLRHQATHDALTGLPNRARFLDRVARALARATRESGTTCAVLFLDLDRFKQVNDTLGHAAGDQLLVAVAARLCTVLRGADTLARMGGDEFAILLDAPIDLAGAREVADRLLAALGPAFSVAGHALAVTTSIGIALPGGPGDTPADLLRCADVALYRAKGAGRSGHATFSPGMDTDVRRRLVLEHDLRRAVERGELIIYFQPKVELATGRVAGLEALVRWHHPARGLVPPGDFIPLAEETGLIMPLGRWVLAEACRHLRGWQERHPGVRPALLGVNLSPGQFRHPDLVADVAAILGAAGLPPAQLMLEVTETAAMEHPAAGIRILEALKALGVRLAIDDFGTGHSSLAYLQQLPVDTLKIDRAFFREGARNRAIVRAVTDLAHGLGLEVTAEGLETAEQVAWAREAGCDRGQGYYFARPLPPEEIDALWAAGLSFDLPLDWGLTTADVAMSPVVVHP